MPGPDRSATKVDPCSRAWISLITRDSYIPGVVLLAYTLYKHNSVHPFIIQYTSALSEDGIQCLQDLSQIHPLCRHQLVEPVPLPNGLGPIATRFNDTLTKLRAFQPLDNAETLHTLHLEKAPERVCFLDADIAIYRNLDDIFDIPLPGPDWISAHHACICNIDNDPWAPEEWNVINCPCTTLIHPSALEAPRPTPKTPGQEKTYKLLNSGVFVCTPSHELWKRIDEFRVSDPRVKNFTFPDQNFLDAFFEGKWVPFGWQYNAFKTHRYWHPEAWRDGEVRALHYIVDKPWERRVGEDGVAGYLGRDGVTHGWWWKECEEWQAKMGNEGEVGLRLLEVMRRHMAKPGEYGRGYQGVADVR